MNSNHQKRRILHVGDLAAQSTIKRRCFECEKVLENTFEEKNSLLEEQTEIDREELLKKNNAIDNDIDNSEDESNDTREDVSSFEEDSEDEEEIVKESEIPLQTNVTSKKENHTDFNTALSNTHTSHNMTNEFNNNIINNSNSADITSKHNVDVLFQRADWRKRSTRLNATTSNVALSNVKTDWQRIVNNKQESESFKKFMSDHFK